jgi:tetratricopeptide (TPR) repeat protein
MRTRGWLAGILAVMAFGWVVSASDALAQGQGRELTPKQRVDKEKREKKALADFSAGKYQEAIDLMAELYADFQEPMYYRNIGRCYQKLGDADRAIAAFEEFLSKAKDAPPATVAETKDLIRQMQELKQKRTGDTQAAPPPPPPPVQTTPTPPTASTPTTLTPPPPTTGNGSTGSLTDATPPPPKASGGSRTLGWVLLGGGAVLLAAGGGVLYASKAEYNKSKDTDGCPNGADVCKTSADMVKQRNLISQILFGVGAAAAIVGGVVLVVSPASSSETAALSPHDFTIALRGRF